MDARMHECVHASVYTCVPVRAWQRLSENHVVSTGISSVLKHMDDLAHHGDWRARGEKGVGEWVGG